MDLKTEILDGIIEIEGGYVDDPEDSGGATRFGITEKTARSYGYDGDMQDLPRPLAFNIYADRYWHSVGGDDLVRLDEGVAREVVDTGVLMGPRRASRYLQRVLNVFNDRGRLYADIAVDGAIGPATIRALGEYLATRDRVVLLRALNALQGAALIELAEVREKDERFAYGWIAKRVVV